MKKTISIVLVVVLLLTIAATCLAAAHEHSFTILTSTQVSNAWKGATRVAGCHNCTYAHTHYTALVTKTYKCACGQATMTERYADSVNKYCPYSH